MNWSTVLHSLTGLSSTFNIVFRTVFTLPGQPYDFAYYYQGSTILLPLLAGLTLPAYLVLSVIFLTTFYWKICTSSLSFKRDIIIACGHIFCVQPHLSWKLFIFWTGTFEDFLIRRLWTIRCATKFPLFFFFFEKNATLLWKNGYKWIIQSIAHC